MTSIQTLKDQIKLLNEEIDNLNERLTTCQRNYKIVNMIKSNSENEHYLVCQYLRKHYPDVLDEALENVSEVLGHNVSGERSLKEHNKRKQVLQGFEE